MFHSSNADYRWSWYISKVDYFAQYCVKKKTAFLVNDKESYRPFSSLFRKAEARLKFTPRNSYYSTLRPRNSYIFRPLTSTCSTRVTRFTPIYSAFGRSRRCLVSTVCACPKVCVSGSLARAFNDTHVCRCDRRERWSRWLRHGRFRLVVRSSLSARALRSTLLRRLSRPRLAPVRSPCDTRAYVHAGKLACT